MEPEDTWKDPMEDDGVTLGPEDTLRKEIEKSKRLKVERLQLRDRIEKLQAQNSTLAQKSEILEEEIQTLKRSLAKGNPSTGGSPTASRAPAPGWALFLLVLNISTLSVLLYFLLLK